jgi:hydrogenase maturation factor
MNLVYGQVLDLYSDDRVQMARVRVGGAVQKVPIDLLTNIQSGDTILMCDGVAIAKVEENRRPLPNQT